MELNLRDGLISLHQHFPVRAMDWWLSAMLLTWGVAVFSIDPKVWDLPIYSGLKILPWSQWEWGVAATALGLIRIVALIVNGAVRPSPHVRAVGAFLTVFIWLQVSLGMLFSESASLAVAIYPWLMFADILNANRAATDACAADQKARDRRNTVAARVPGRA